MNCKAGKQAKPETAGCGSSPDPEGNGELLQAIDMGEDDHKPFNRPLVAAWQTD